MILQAQLHPLALLHPQILDSALELQAVPQGPFLASSPSLPQQASGQAPLQVPYTSLLVTKHIPMSAPYHACMLIFHIARSRMQQQGQSVTPRAKGFASHQSCRRSLGACCSFWGRSASRCMYVRAWGCTIDCMLHSDTCQQGLLHAALPPYLP